MTAQDYPVTFGYRATDGNYYGPNGSVGPYHRGEDRTMPVGTPVDVNGVTIGLSGSMYGGPHLHVGRFVNGSDTNPNGQGFRFDNATVSGIGEDATNGKYVRVQADGASWVYLHLSDNSLVKTGTPLKGAPMFNEGDATNFNVYFFGKDNGQFRDFIGKDWKTASYGIQEQLKNEKRLLVNDGDVENLTNAGVANAEKANNQDWKTATYEVVLPSVGGNYKKLNQDVFVRAN